MRKILGIKIYNLIEYHVMTFLIFYNLKAELIFFILIWLISQRGYLKQLPN